MSNKVKNYYELLPKDLKRETKLDKNYKKHIIMFKLNDNVSINNIIRNHNIHGIDKNKFKEHYINATNEPRQFFLLDLKNPATHLRQNFLNILSS